MTLGKCPLCGSPVRAKEAKPHSRLACGKCHANLHLSKDRRLVLGEPPDPEAEYRQLQRDIRRAAGQVPYRKILIGLAVVLVFGLGLHQLFGPAEKLDSVAEEAAKALAGDDLAALESLAASGTTEDVRRWYDAVHPKLARLREKWGGKKEAVEAHVASEDPDQRKGAVGVTIRPVLSGARDVSLANPSEATAGATDAFEEATDWTLTRWGRWKIDGRATIARLSPSTVAR